ncbi:MAG: hypothetical protein ABWZ25_11620 [Chitinophagaceae bacterium]
MITPSVCRTTLLFSILLSLYNIGYSQTIMTGGIVPVGMSALNNTIRLALLVKIPAGTTVKITDRGWNRSLLAFTPTMTGDGIITWTPLADVAAGNVLILTLSGSGVATLTNATTSDNYSGTFTIQGYTVADPLIISGDGITIYQGLESDPWFISAINNSLGPVDSYGWNITISQTLRDAQLPGGGGSQNFLTNGVNAMGNQGTQLDNFQYTGPVTPASGETWLARMVDYGSWSGDDVGTISSTIVTSIALLSPLPVTLLSFSAAKQGNNVQLQWQVADEVNFSRYEVESSEDGSGFFMLASVTPLSGSGTKIYNWTHANVFSNASGNNRYYRLKLIDVDGTAEYSRLVHVNTFDIQKNSITLLANPVQDLIALDVRLLRDGTLSIQLSDLNGKTILQQQRNLLKGVSNLQIPIPVGLSQGLYLLTVVFEEERFVMKLLRRRD